MTDFIALKTFGTAALAGAECGLIGVFIFLLNIPFIGVAIAHAAMAGGIWGEIAGIQPKLAAFLASLFASGLAGPAADRSKMNPNITLSIIFSASMGLAFLGLGIMPAGNSTAMRYLWGNIFMTGVYDIILMALALVVLCSIIIVYYRQYSAVLFNREIAASLGINEKLLYYLILAAAGAVITVNLNTIGGLMLFSLIIIPPAAAYQLAYDMKKFFVLSALFGASGGLGGAAVSFAFNWPVSASVVLFTTAIFIIVLAVSPKRLRRAG